MAMLGVHFGPRLIPPGEGVLDPHTASGMPTSVETPPPTRSPTPQVRYVKRQDWLIKSLPYLAQFCCATPNETPPAARLLTPITLSAIPATIAPVLLRSGSCR